MKPVFAFDTSALVSLGHTDLVDLIIQNCDVIMSNTVLSGLRMINSIEDEDGVAAGKWLRYLEYIDVEGTAKKKCGEDELLEICKKKDIPMVIDDIKATRRFKDEVEWLFSIHIIYLLYSKGLISREKALFSIDKMRNKRSWKDNIIAVTGRTLFE